MDVDSGRNAPALVRTLSVESGAVRPGWVRLRGIAEPASAQAGERSIAETREALAKLRAQGLKSCVMLRWPAADWRKKYLPEDLREAYARGHFLGASYGDLVDAWEIDNEPDLGFVPENAERYAAFFKAMYWGIKAGSAELLGARKPATSSQELGTRELATSNQNLEPSSQELGTRKLATRDEELATRKLAPSTQGLAPSAQSLAPSAQHLATSDQELGARKLAARDEELATRKLAPSTQNLATSAQNLATRKLATRTEHLEPSTQNLEPSAQHLAPSNQNLATRPPPSNLPAGSAGRVLMASLGLPPGPWFEQFVANDGLAYTDGYNYHYYGFAADFTAYYRQHEAAVAQLGFAAAARSEDARPASRSLPVFMTEIGYGMLYQQAAQTKEGRIKQWRWFASVGEQVSALAIEAPMAFYLPPYLEYERNEYGLTVTRPVNGELGARSQELGARNLEPSTENLATRSLEPSPEPLASSSQNLAPSPKPLATNDENLAPSPEPLATRNLAPSNWRAGGIVYGPEDFGAKAVEPWMHGIGREVLGYEATPALAAWWAKRAGFHESDRKSGRWEVSPPAPSPVVLDFLPGKGLMSLKRYNGHFVTAVAPVVEAAAAAPVPAAPTKPTPAAASVPPPAAPAPLHREEILIQIRTEDDNLFEVYPLRRVGPEWQNYLEERGNFTLSPYSRASGDWRFSSGRPVSLSISARLKQVPAALEFRQVQIVRLRLPEAGAGSGSRSVRYGTGRVVLYNFSDQVVTGRLVLPAPMRGGAGDPGRVRLEPGERQEVPVTIELPADVYRRHKATVLFESDDAAVPAARLETDFLPGLERSAVIPVASLLDQGAAGEKIARSVRFLRDRRTVEEEHPRPVIQGNAATAVEDPGLVHASASRALRVERTADGFAIVSEQQPGADAGAIEVELPWPDDAEFPDDAFLRMDIRLRPLEP